MARKVDLIHRALTEIGISSSTNMPAEIEDLTTALDTLQPLMAEWESQDYLLGYNFQEPTTANPNLMPDLNDESNIPIWAQNAVVYELAMRLSSRYGKTASRDLKVQHKESMSRLRVATIDVPIMPRPGTMPIGSGYKRHYRYNRYYRTRDEIEISNFQDQQEDS